MSFGESGATAADVPAARRGLGLALVLAAAVTLAFEPARAQQTASGGAQVQITPGVTCTAQVCYTSTDAGSLLYSNTGDPITVNNSTGFAASVQAINGGAVQLDGGGSVSGYIALHADGGTITATGIALTQLSGRNGGLIGGLINVRNGGQITLNGTTTITMNGQEIIPAAWARGVGTRITFTGPISASLPRSTGFWAQLGASFTIAAGGTITDFNNPRPVFWVDGDFARSTMDLTGLTVGNGNNAGAFAQVTDQANFTIKDSTIGISPGSGLFENADGAPIYSVFQINELEGTGASFVNLDNTVVTTGGVQDSHVFAVSGGEAHIAVTNGSVVTAKGGRRGSCWACMLETGSSLVRPQRRFSMRRTRPSSEK